MSREDCVGSRQKPPPIRIYFIWWVPSNNPCCVWHPSILSSLSLSLSSFLSFFLCLRLSVSLALSLARFLHSLISMQTLASLEPMIEKDESLKPFNQMRHNVFSSPTNISKTRDLIILTSYHSSCSFFPLSTLSLLFFSLFLSFFLSVYLPFLDPV